jgi:Gpi18-like mannosyltransferase
LKLPFFVFYLLLFLLIANHLPEAGFGLDMLCWKKWTKYIFFNGLGNAYKSDTDYLPLMQWFMYAFGKIQITIQNVVRNMNYIKVIPLAFEFVGGFYLVKMASEKITSPSRLFFLSLFYFLNIAVFYNTLFWGQVDGVYSVMLFISVYYAHKKKIFTAIIFFLFALNFKLQAIVFLPLIGLMILPELIRTFNPKKFIAGVLVLCTIQFLILLPFILVGDLQRLIDVITESFKKYPVVSMNAAGFWNWFISREMAYTIPDSTLFSGVSYKSWGLLMFFTFSFLALLPLLKHILKELRQRNSTSFPLEKILIIGTLIPMIFCYFNTEMHERYVHPAVIFVLAYSIISGNSWPALLICLAYFLHLERGMRILELKNYETAIFHSLFFSILYLISMIILFLKLYEIKIFSFKTAGRKDYTVLPENIPS